MTGEGRVGGNLYLTGLPGSGKTSVGRLLAQALGRPFVDMDAEIEARVGLPAADIFREGGEARFRRLEHELLRELARQSGLVVATGGGVVEAPENRELLKRSGEPVWLYCDVERAVARALQQGTQRPLLGSSPAEALERARRLWDRRQWWYARAPIWVDGRHDDPARVVREALDALEWARTVRTAAWVLAPGHACPILVGSGLIDRMGEVTRLLARRHGLGGTAFVVADRAVGALARRVAHALRDAGFRPAVSEVGPGEPAKEPDALWGLYEKARQAGLDRAGLVVAVGGGAALDVAGFMAATYMRGVPWVSVPTTLLAQVDAAVGGKTAINAPRAKNLVGAFHQPLAVVADLQALETLPRRERAAGMAEVVKHGLVGDPWLWERIEEDGAAPGAGSSGALAVRAEVVERAVAVKALVVTEDPGERGRRAILNFGHTTAHALEAAGDFRRHLHGEAVAIGMVTATMLSARLGLLREAGLVDRLRRVLRGLDLPADAGPRPPDPDQLWDLMASDKKRLMGRRRFVLLRGPGDPVVLADAVDRELFAEVWRAQHGVHAPEGSEG